MSKKLVYLLSNSHIDVAWMWPKTETKEVMVETFENAIRMIEKYGVTYAQSNMVYYEWLLKENKELLEKIKELSKRSKWEVVGGSWVEFDANMPLGESLVRQFVYGKKLARQLFGLDVEVCWLPDTFGFPFSLPKILRHVGIKYFLTSKLSWNDTTEFPYHIFWWVGDDGSKVLAYLSPGSYEEKLTLENIEKWIEKLENKNPNAKTMLFLYGRGDHGGGPEPFEGELARKLEREGKAKNATSLEFFKKTEDLDGEIPEWKDELYLQFHRGVYTSQLTIKDLIRRCEALAIDLETISAILWANKEEISESEPVEEWKTILTNQFHDIFSGTLSTDATVEAISELISCYRSLKKKIDMLLQNKKERLYLNTLPWARREIIEINGESYLWEANAYSTGDVKPVKNKNKLRQKGRFILVDNGKLVVAIDKKQGVITQIFHKETNKKILSGPIRIRIYDDSPIHERKSVTGIPASVFDAWEIFAFDRTPKYLDVALKETRIIRSGAITRIRALGRIKISPRESAKIAIIYIIKWGEEHIDLDIKIDSRLKHRLVKLIVPLNTENPETIFGAPYGKTIRIDPMTPQATLEEKAKYESPTTGWVAIKDGGYTIWIATNNRMGVSRFGKTIGVSILKTALYPSKKQIRLGLRLPKWLKNPYFYETKVAKFLMRFGEWLLRMTYNEFMDQGTKRTKVRLGYTKGTHIVAIRKWKELLHPPYQIGKKLSLPLNIEGNVIIHTKIAESKEGLVFRIWNPNDVEEPIKIKTKTPIKLLEVDGLEQRINDLGEISPNETKELKISSNKLTAVLALFKP